MFRQWKSRLLNTMPCKRRILFGLSGLVVLIFRSPRAMLADPPQPDSNTALLQAVQNGKIDTVVELIKHVHNVDIAEDAGKTALLYAADAQYWLQRSALVQLLLVGGAKVNDQDKQGMTALLYAAQQEGDETIARNHSAAAGAWG